MGDAVGHDRSRQTHRSPDQDEKVWAGWATAACSKHLPLAVDQSHQYHQGATGPTQTQTAELAFTKIARGLRAQGSL